MLEAVAHAAEDTRSGGTSMAMLRVWWVVLLCLLGGCASAPVAGRVELPREDDSAEDCTEAAEEDDDEGCVTVACVGDTCGLYQCEDVSSAPLALRGGGVAAPMVGVGTSPQRYWGAPQVMPGREPVFVIRWHRREELPSQKALRKAREAWEKVPKEKHHIFPRAFEKYFEEQGINIHEYALAIDVKRHKEIHGGGAEGAPWNKDWSDYIERLNKRLPKRETRRLLFERAGYLIQKYRLVGMPMSYWQQLTANMRLAEDG
ncbi:TIGR02269 family lipoprotein [Myxococcus stipitatus]|uniref:SitA6 family polymorphic toxin lipoprotein n=1 Tax=Myxococcus stipitatus TaxID=83455 RepID=UPI001F33915C|nr:TIGR02269 family lipoprotein [Myxococcus stipitatus]MCE9667772.1 TIGR02269 family lipoprotein [Myxococcus stipitatus]